MRFFRLHRASRSLNVLLSLAALLAVFVVPGSASAQTAPVDTSTFTKRVLDLTNAERAKRGLPGLTANAALNKAAQDYAYILDDGKCFSHYCAPTPDIKKRLEIAGYTFAGYRSWSYGENIAAGQTTPETVVAAWMASSGHRANILNSTFRELGVGYAYNSAAPYKHYWVQDFGMRR